MHLLDAFFFSYTFVSGSRTVGLSQNKLQYMFIITKVHFCDTEKLDNTPYVAFQFYTDPAVYLARTESH